MTVYPEAKKDLDTVRAAIALAEEHGEDCDAAYEALLRLFAALLAATEVNA